MLIGARRAQDLVKQLLIFGRKSQSERGPVRVQAVLAEALALMRGAIPSTIEIRSEIAPTCPSILADHTELHQVVMNLCTNAAHSMRERGGVLEISLQEARLSPDSAARTPGLEPGPYLRLMVRDTGCGMDAATRQRIFEPYFTTKRPGEGTGLGLAIVHGVVKGLGGVILVESEVGMGSCFEVYLPVDPRARASVEAIRRAAEDRAETGSQAGAPTP